MYSVLYFGQAAFLLSSKLSDNLDSCALVDLNTLMIQPNALGAKKTTTLLAQVAEFLRAGITQGRLRPGDRLRENEWCQQLGVSRSTLREALRKLEAERLIVIEPHRGPSVAVMTMQAAHDLYAVRALIEGYAAREFAVHADNKRRAQLKAAFSALKAQAAKRDRGALLAAKQAFYDVLLNGCNNTVVADLLPSLLSRINLLRATSFTQADRTPKSLCEIEQIVLSITKRDPDGAERAARFHIQQAEIAATLTMAQMENINDNRR